MSKYSRITASRLRLAMDKRGMSAQELSDKSGVTKASISQYVNGHYTPTTKNAEKLAVALGCAPEWIMGVMDEDTKLQSEYVADVIRGMHPKVMKIVDLTENMEDFFIDKLLDYATKLHNMQNDL